MKPEKNLEQQIRTHYESKRLSSSMIDEIRILRKGSERERRSSRFSVRWLSIAAVIAILIAATALLLVPRDHGAAEEIAMIAARDHNRRLAVEVRASDYDELRAKMARLDFNPVMPQRAAEMSLRVVGARYSSVGGLSAIEIKLVEPSGGICTLIQVRADERLARIGSSQQFVIDGLRIDVWKEKGLVMALARTA
ncbi:MAG: hypothetical protein KY459_02795 [Acidobacteria bacterium]|nr:hypothetical protein [Acidobacteriota bacterium]